MEWQEFLAKMEEMRIASGALMVISAPVLYGNEIIGIFDDSEEKANGEPD